MKKRRSRSQVSVRLVVLTAVLCVASGVAWTAWRPPIRIAAGSMEIAAPESWAACVHEAARLSGVDRALFHAIVSVESAYHPYAFGWTDAAGARHTYKAPTYTDAVAHFARLAEQRVVFDVGAAQINSRNFRALQARTGIGGLQGLDPCTNLHFAAMILREQILVHGATWRAVAGYNGADAYAPRVFRRYCLAADDEQCRDPHTLRDLLCLPLASTHAVWRASRPAGW